jgi:hypothetical protein
MIVRIVSALNVIGDNRNTSEDSGTVCHLKYFKISTLNVFK